MTLNEAQRRAVERIGQDVCVEAGPGSGKTRVLIERFRWLVDNGVAPDRILAFTFTEKAAAEIKSRLSKAFEDHPELRASVEHAWVSTVHGFCARFLRENAIDAGIDPDFSVVEELKSIELLRESADEALEQIYQEQPELMVELLEALDAASASGQRRPDIAQSVLDIYDKVRTTGSRIEDLLATRPQPDPEFSLAKLVQDVESLARRLPASTPPQRERVEKLRTWLLSARPLPAAPRDAIRLLESFELKGIRAPHSEEVREIRDTRIPALLSEYASIYYSPLRAILADAVARLDSIYRGKKRSRSGLDFADLEEKAIALLESSPEICERARQTFEHILMDELQDTNPLQWRLVDLLRTPGCFFAVGDINQSIFGFRHATPEAFRAYRDGLASQGFTIDTLRQNYRSAPEILETVNNVFAGAVGIEPHHLTTERTNRRGTPVEVRAASAETTEEAAAIESKWVARRILELSAESPFGKMAVLLRTLNSFGPLQRALEELRIPFQVTGAKSFFESREIRDLLQWLRVLDNPLDEISLAGVLRSPLVGVRDETILRLKQTGGLYESILRLGSAGLPPDEFDRLTIFRARLKRSLAARDFLSPDRLLIRAIDETGYDASLTSAGRAAISRLLDLLRSAHQDRTGSYSALLEEIERHRESESEIEVASTDAVKAVRIMSVHRAKGLEFEVVFLPFLHRQPGFSRPSICHSPDQGIAVRWRSPVSEQTIAEPAHNYICDELRNREQEEENRLLYVALTRAEKRLVLSYSEAKRAAGGWAALIANSMPETVLRTTISAPPDPYSDVSPPVLDPAPEIVQPPLITDQHDSVVTVTSLSEFQSCPRRYYLGRYLGWHTSPNRKPKSRERDPEEDEHMEASEFGRQVHQALAGACPAGIDPGALALAQSFIRGELGRRISRATRVEREYEFVTNFDGIVVRGQIDLWFEESGELILVDYKTDRFHPEAEPERTEGYQLQLRIYAIALQRITGRLPDRAVLEFLRSGVSVDVELSPELLKDAQLVLNRLAESQESMEFPLLEGSHCMRCEYFRNSCPARGPFTVSVQPPSSVVARP
jgi:ATP-dependent exoDNAse (exonuclease V) beta subunit